MTKLTEKDERGFILVLALVTMLAMTLIGLSVVMNMTTDLQLSRNERDSKAAFQLAEAGVQEVMSRLRLPVGNARYIGEVSTDAGYRDLGTWNSDGSKDFGFGNGNLSRRSADNLNYSVTIEYLGEGNPENLCDGNSTGPNNSTNHTDPNDNTWTCNDSPEEIVMYGRDFNIVHTATYVTYGKHPVYRVTSTGTSNNISRTVVAYVGASALNTDAEAGITTNQTITWNGGDCSTSVDPAGSCQTGQDIKYDEFLGEDLDRIKEMANERHQCTTLAPNCNGTGDDIPSSGMLGSVVEDWGDASGDSYSTLIYIDNASGRDVSINGLEGRGIFVVTGDLELAGNVNYEGLIYVLGTLTISGGGSNTKNITGAVMAQNVVELNGSNLMIQYDQDTLEDVAKQNSTPALVLWKRL